MSLLVKPVKDTDRFKNIGENDQTDIYYTHIATLDKGKEYSESDIKHNTAVLEREVRLLHRIRYGQLDFEPVSTSPGDLC